MEKCNKYTVDNLVRHFDSLAPNYDGLYNYVGWPDPEKVAEFVVKYVKDKNAKILDVGCGTGLVG